MNNQLALNFSAPAPYQRHSATSKAAALSAEPTAGTKRAIALAFLRGRGHVGATDEEMQELIPLTANTQRPRRPLFAARRLATRAGGGLADDSASRR